jgi:hypothetical protein
VNTWPNSYPTLEPGSARWCESPDSKPRVERCSWSVPDARVPMVAGCCRGVLTNNASARWHMQLSIICGSDDIQLSGCAGSASALNSAAAWRLNLQPRSRA